MTCLSEAAAARVIITSFECLIIVDQLDTIAGDTGSSNIYVVYGHDDMNDDDSHGELESGRHANGPRVLALQCRIW